MRNHQLIRWKEIPSTEEPRMSQRSADITIRAQKRTAALYWRALALLCLVAAGCQRDFTCVAKELRVADADG